MTMLSREARALWNQKAQFYQNMDRQFAAANGWKVGRDFTLDQLIRNSSRRTKEHYFDYLPEEFFDHPTFFVADRKPVAIVVHNYSDPEKTAVYLHDRALRLHVPEAGKKLSWYYVGGTWPMCVTRSDISEVIRPTEAELAPLAELQKKYWLALRAAA
jgi:hypothetical protein